MIASSTLAAEKYTVELEMKEGELIPRVLNVPAKTLYGSKFAIPVVAPLNLKALNYVKKSISAWGEFCRCDCASKTWTLHLL